MILESDGGELSYETEGQGVRRGQPSKDKTTRHRGVAKAERAAADAGDHERTAEQRVGGYSPCPKPPPRDSRE